jgi:hypothetical protein
MNKRWVIVVLAGLAAGCACMKKMGHKEAEEGEGKEMKMSIDQVPGPVRDTLMREAGGAKITSVDQEDHHGKMIYETDVMMNGKNYEIKVDADGTLLCKKLDMEEGEKAGMKEKEEEEEKEEHHK